MNKQEFTEVISFVKALAKGEKVDVKKIDRNLTADIMVAAFHVPQYSFKMPDIANGESVAADLAIKGMMSMTTVLLEDAIRGPLRDFDTLSNEEKLLTETTIPLGIMIAASKWLQHFKIDEEFPYTDAPHIDSVMQSVVILLGEGADRFYSAIDRLDLSIPIDADTIRRYDRNALIMANAFTGIKAIFKMRGANFALADELLDDMYGFKYDLADPQITVTRERITDLTSRGRDGCATLLAMLKDKKTLH